MELRHLRHFVALAETRNFHRAAERLHIAQPPLSVSIRKLETELGTQLFERGSRGVEPTPAAQAALPFARAALAEVERFRAVAREGEAGERGRLRVGFVGSATFDLLPRSLLAYRERYPLVELDLVESNSLAIARQLHARELDVGLIRLPLLEAAAVDARVIELDELHAAVASGSPFARLEKVDLAALRGEPFVLQSRISVLHAISLLACHQAGFAPRIAQEAEQISAILALVRSGLGVALLPARARSALPQGVALIPLVDPVPIEMGLALPVDRATILAQNFARLIDT